MSTRRHFRGRPSGSGRNERPERCAGAGEGRPGVSEQEWQREREEVLRWVLANIGSVSTEPLVMQLASERARRDAEIAEMLNAADRACGLLAEAAANDLDHDNRDHSRWYWNVKRYRRLRGIV